MFVKVHATADGAPIYLNLLQVAALFTVLSADGTVETVVILNSENEFHIREGPEDILRAAMMAQSGASSVLLARGLVAGGHPAS